MAKSLQGSVSPIPNLIYDWNELCLDQILLNRVELGQSLTMTKSCLNQVVSCPCFICTEFYLYLVLQNTFQCEPSIVWNTNLNQDKRGQISSGSSFVLLSSILAEFSQGVVLDIKCFTFVNKFTFTCFYVDRILSLQSLTSVDIINA